MEGKKAPLEREKKRLKNERYRDRCDWGGGGQQDMVGIKEKKKHWQVDC